MVLKSCIDCCNFDEALVKKRRACAQKVRVRFNDDLPYPGFGVCDFRNKPLDINSIVS